MHTIWHLSWGPETLSQSWVIVSCVAIIMGSTECFPMLNFVKMCLHQSKVKVNLLNLSDKLKIWDLLKGSMFLLEVGQCYGKNYSRVWSTALNSAQPEHVWFFLSGSLLGVMYPQIPRVYSKDKPVWHITDRNSEQGLNPTHTKECSNMLWVRLSLLWFNCFTYRKKS
jgi:hypothetical protein